eukprot:CAMPEP_0169278716 /NCGR_PEP_ID=MMETSP1016-20121227/54499_1 /TAXON_ID=342587 /ORGANISM="Karlodinium micrum, Strain CCMP2283" /LENGTH=604 /DNA_ID=CAMNT_0009366547 /DNA_START=150 /DNA_END=1964 /DNA_ORIENTATION=-
MRPGSVAVTGVAARSVGDVTESALAIGGEIDPEVDIADVSGKLIFSDGELQGHIEGNSSEFERLMEDSVDSDRIVSNLGFAAPEVALRSPRGNASVEASPQLSSLRGSPVRRIVDLVTGEPIQPLTSTEGDIGTSTPPMRPQPPADFSAPKAKVNLPEPDALCREVFFDSSESRDTWAVRQLASRMEQVGREMRASVEHEFIIALQGCITQHRAALESEKMKAEASAYQQQALIESLQEEKQQLTKRLELKQRQLKDVLWKLSRAQNGVVGKCTLERAMCAWRTITVAEKDGRINQVLAKRLHGHHSGVAAFSTWRCHAQAGIKSKLINHERAAAEMVRAKLFEQLETDRTRSAAEVDRLSRLVAEEAQQRQFLQENLKSAFLRGVCALNREAMSLLSPDGSSGVEPSTAIPTGQMPSQASAPLPVPVASPPPSSPAFDWAEFEARSTSATASLSVGIEPAPHLTDTPATNVAANSQVVSSSRGEAQRLFDVLDSNHDGVISRGELQDAYSGGIVREASSPRQPPVPAPQPLPTAPQPLPFVNWNSPSEPPSAVGSVKVSQVRSSLKSQRWQQANTYRVRRGRFDLKLLRSASNARDAVGLLLQ